MRSIWRRGTYIGLAGAIFAAGGVAHKFISDFRANNSAFAEYIEARTAHMRAFPHRGAIVMLGDSITEGGDWQAIFPGVDIVNRGISASTTTDIIGRLDTVLASHPRQVFVMLGTNDLVYGVEERETLANMRKIVKTLHESAADVVVQSPPHSKNVQIERGISRLAVAYRQLCEQEPCRFVLTEIPASMTWDGIHLTPDGYRIWADVIRPYLLLGQSAS